MTCVAKGGPADYNGSVQIGDTLLFIDDLDVRELMNNVSWNAEISRDGMRIQALFCLGIALPVC